LGSIIITNKMHEHFLRYNYCKITNTENSRIRSKATRTTGDVAMLLLLRGHLREAVTFCAQDKIR